MLKTTRIPAVIDIPDVNGAFVGNTMRPFTRDEFDKIKIILAKKRRRNAKLTITDRDLRAAGLEHLLLSLKMVNPASENGALKWQLKKTTHPKSCGAKPF
jgi:hypothetical protein